MGQIVFQATLGGQTALVGQNTASSYSLNIPAVNGNLVTTGDTGTVTNTMLASNAYTAPGTIGSGTPNTGKFTSLTSTSNIINGATSGSVTLAVPAVAGSNTATLPAVTGTVMVSGNMPAFSVYANTNQTVTSSAFTKVILNTKTFDTNSNFDSTTNYRFTPTVAGYYQLNGIVNGGQSTSTTRLFANIFKNGSQVFQGNDISFSGGGSTVSGILYMNGSTDYVELYVYVTGVSTALQGGIQYTNFNGSMIRSA
jgi:hypothetical protein